MQSLLHQAVKSQQQYKSLLENSLTITYINSIDENTHTEYVSPQVEKLLGCSRDLFVNDTLFWKKILHTDDYERIFGLFNRLDPNINGTGIGLTLVKRIIEIYDGRIWVQSAPGAGATFYFTLPQD